MSCVWPADMVMGAADAGIAATAAATQKVRRLRWSFIVLIPLNIWTGRAVELMQFQKTGAGRAKM
jgi:hypothetical protein